MSLMNVTSEIRQNGDNILCGHEDMHIPVFLDVNSLVWILTLKILTQSVISLVRLVSLVVFPAVDEDSLVTLRI